MANELSGKRVAFLATDGVEPSELQQPWDAAKSAGAEVELVSIKEGSIQGIRKMEKAETFPVDALVGDVDSSEFDALVLPGGVANPDKLRMNDDAVAFVEGFFEERKPVAAICHGPWMLVEADVLDGRTLTSYPSLRTDIENAGGRWVDEEVHVDRGLVTSRRPEDLPAFCSKMIEEIREGIHEGRAPRAVTSSSRNASSGSASSGSMGFGSSMSPGSGSQPGSQAMRSEPNLAPDIMAGHEQAHGGQRRPEGERRVGGDSGSAREKAGASASKGEKGSKGEKSATAEKSSARR